MGRRRAETGLFMRAINFLTNRGTTIVRTTDFWGRPKTVVHNYDTGTKKEYTHNKGFFGNRTDVKVFHNGRKVGKGNIKSTFLGHDVEKLEYTHGRVKKSVKKMNCGIFGNRDKSQHYGDDGGKIGEAYGRKGLIFSGYSRSYKGSCFSCNGTGVFPRTGETCRKCGGTGIFVRRSK